MDENPNENFSARTMAYWIMDFEKLQIKADEVVQMIKRTNLKKIYGKVCFNDFLEEGQSYIDYEEVYKIAHEKFLTALENMGMTYEDYGQKCLEIERGKDRTNLLEISRDDRIKTQVTNYKEKDGK